MGEQAILTALKVDLQISTSAMDTYLGQLITAARSYISREGITLTESVEDGMLVEMYAAYLYRRRREENVQMPPDAAVGAEQPPVFAESEEDLMDDVLVLVQPQLAQNAIGDFVPAGPPLTQQIFGSISSINRAEWYSAGQEGRKPELVFTTPTSITAVSRSGIPREAI